MGVTRAGWYSYDLLDNLARRSAERILPEYQTIQGGSSDGSCAADRVNPCGSIIAKPGKIGARHTAPEPEIRIIAQYYFNR